MSVTSFFDIFVYDKKTGKLLWKVNRPKRKAGSEAGNVRSDGRYRTVHATVNGIKKRHYAHRIIWEMVNGSIPKDMVIDHIDGNTLNNKLENLRLVTREQNQRNSKTPSNNTSGEVGIYRNHVPSFVVIVAGKNVGSFATMKEAIEARDAKYIELGFHENHGRAA